MKRFASFLLLLWGMLLASPLLAQTDSVESLAGKAESELLRGNESEAVRLYEEVLKLAPEHRQAHIFLGNYYYLKAEKARTELENDFGKLASPTRMQYANYRNRLSALFEGDYATAKKHLRQVLLRFSSTEAAATLKRIEALEAQQ